ncbi:hypothetical protein [Candidatus Uabimicrobium amorphum]|uniref:Uncharacterized protein n=1 Tax=Uabimicrobium amorphum TaxID=2596890 RepID=A0A5S9IRJ2_UABAM|nr:hypothetical protein [Candidatus Uabimicrobium amorphum]BBM85375.1 hypothetical protein UABAM_03741 [Candidatus Uabimicrobium amorphum]
MKKIMLMLFVFIVASFSSADTFSRKDGQKLDADIKSLKLNKKLEDILTVKGWRKQRKKAGLSKKKHKTGLADVLKRVEANHKSISDNKDNLVFPDVFSPKITKAADVTNAVKLGRDGWKQVSNLMNELNKAADLAEKAAEAFGEEKETLEENAKKNKKKIAKMQIAIDAVNELKDEAEKFSKKIKKTKPKKWLKKFQSSKKNAIAFVQATDELKKTGMNPLDLIKAMALLNAVFSGGITDVCSDYEGKVIPELEKLRNDPQALANKFNGTYLAKDAGTRRVSQNTSNIMNWKGTFGVDFPYDTGDIDDVITHFDAWGNGGDAWTPENAVEQLNTYIEDINALKGWAVATSAQWEKDKTD